MSFCHRLRLTGAGVGLGVILSLRCSLAVASSDGCVLSSFVWFDCGGPQEYKAFLEEYWSLCCGYIFFHFTYSDGAPNSAMDTIMTKAANEPFKIDIVEPHKTRQGSITIVKKQLV